MPRQYAGSPVWDPRGDGVYLKTPATEGGALARLERVSVNSRGGLGTPKAIGGLTVSEMESFSIVGPARTLLYVEGGQERTVEALTRDDAGSITFTSRLLRRSTGELGATVSPDGRYIIFFSKPVESLRTQLAILPFEGGAETRVPLTGSELVDVSWAWNSPRLFYSVKDTGDKATLYTFDPASGRGRTVGPIASRLGLQAVRHDLLAWIDDSAGAIVLADTNGAELRRLPDPDRSELYGDLYGSPDGRSMLTTRWSAGFDTLLFTKIDLADGRRQRLGELKVEAPAGVFWGADGTIQAAVLETLGTLAFYRLDQRGGPPVRLDSHPVEGLVYYTFSRDGRHAIKVEGRPRGDVWMVRNFDGRGRAE